jgi:Glyoxalase-like domain
MNRCRASLDHLTVAALSLEQGVAHVHRSLGVVAPPGGSHPLMATHNHLMKLGDGVFLEIIAPDHNATPQRTRWFGLDDPAMRASLAMSPRLISWVARVPDLTRALREIDTHLGEAVSLARGSLSWLMSVRRDGSMPFDGAFPTLIEWPAGPHASEHMADLGCELGRLSIEHPEGERLSRLLDPIIADERVVVSSGAAMGIRATIATPYGPRELS